MLYFHGKKCWVESLDMKDLYYSLNMKLLFEKLTYFLEAQLAGLQPGSGIAAVRFLKLLALYLESSVVELNGSLWTENEGACIGLGVHWSAF